MPCVEVSPSLNMALNIAGGLHSSHTLSNMKKKWSSDMIGSLTWSMKVQHQKQCCD
jgi:hypothetical protein